MGEQYLVFLPINVDQADIIGMPADIFEAAVRRLGRKVWVVSSEGGRIFEEVEDAAEE